MNLGAMLQKELWKNIIYYEHTLSIDQTLSRKLYTRDSTLKEH